MKTESISPGDEWTTYALLLQGINVGGHSLLPMTVLRDILTGLEFSEVRSYLQSGNAVFTTSLNATEVAMCYTARRQHGAASNLMWMLSDCDK